MKKLFFAGPRPHVCWHLTAASLGVLVGIVMALVANETFMGLQWPIMGGTLLLFVLRKRHFLLITASIIAGMLIGVWSGSNHRSKLEAYNALVGQQVVLTGTVKDDTMRGPDGGQRLQLTNNYIDNVGFAGTVWINTAAETSIKRGDIVMINGRLYEGFGTIAASVFRANVVKVIRPEPGDVGRQVRDWFAEKVRLSMAEPQASLGVSYLVGQRRALPIELSDTLQTLGLVHLVVASGFHLTIAVRFSRRIFGKFSKYAGLLAAFGVIAGFLLLTGFSTSMIRAALVTGLSLLAWSVGRVFHPVPLLLIVAAATALINPSFLWGDIGWYLSFAAFAGVIILAPLIHDYFWGQHQRPSKLRELLITTLSAQITTLPLVAFTFGQYSPLSLLANLLILPLVPFTMLLTLIAGLLSAVLPGAAIIFGYPAYTLLSYMTKLTSWLVSTPYAHSEFIFGPASLFVGYFVILCFTAHLWIKTRHNFKKQNFVE